jgi:NUMOD4 motif
LKPDASIKGIKKGVIVEDVWARILEAPTYEISRLGDVRNRGTGRILKSHKNNYGTRQVTLREGNRTVTRSVNALLKRAFE